MRGGVVITGTLYNKSGKVIAVGEREALSYYLDSLKKLNPKTFKKRDFEVKCEYNPQAIKEAPIIIAIGFGGTFQIYSKS